MRIPVLGGERIIFLLVREEISKKKKKKKARYMPLVQHPGSRGRRISVSSRPVCTT